MQALMQGDAQRCYDFCNFIMNRLQIQTLFLADIIWTRLILCTIASSPGIWKILDLLLKFDIRYAGR